MKSTEDRLRRRGRLSLQETMQLLSQACKALGRAHELGIVHRDLKPRNLFIADVHDEEIIKILDFGIAKRIGAFGVAGATTSQVMGTPHYMSPEQIRGVKDIDHRSDLWSLGVILFKAVTGTLPFPGEVLIDVLNRVISGPIPAPTQFVNGLPVALDDFFHRALNRDRAQRFQSAREMADAFAEITRTSAMPRQTNPSTPDSAQTAPAVTEQPSIPLLLNRPANPMSATVPLKTPEPITTVTETVPKSAVLDASASQRPSRVSPVNVVLFMTALFLAGGSHDRRRLADQWPARGARVADGVCGGDQPRRVPGASEPTAAQRHAGPHRAKPHGSRKPGDDTPNWPGRRFNGIPT